MLISFLSAVNFIDWFSFLNIDVTAQGVTMPLSEWVAQYACVQTNFVMTIAGLIAIGILALKRVKKWWWYVFFAILTVVSITSVGMHTANYGEFQSGIITTKLVGSYIDMSFTIFTAWSGVCCFIFEFCDKKFKKPFAIAISSWTALVILTLTIEVFVFKDRPLFLFGGGAAMDGATGGFSIAEFCCFLTALPLIPIAVINAKKLDKTEVGLVSFVIAIFIIGFIVSNLFGDNQVNSLIVGNLHTHSLWHMLNGLGALTIVFWIDYRTFKDIAEGKTATPGIKPYKLLKANKNKEEAKEVLAASENENFKKKELNNWSIITGIVYLYVLISLIFVVVGFIKGMRGDYSNYDFSPFQFTITSAILFVGLNIIGVFSILKLVKVIKSNKKQNIKIVTS